MAVMLSARSVYDDGSGILYFFVDGNPDSSGGYSRVLIGNPEGCIATSFAAVNISLLATNSSQS